MNHHLANLLPNSAGALTLEQIQTLEGFSGPERLARGPVAIIECLQDIPCNPCESACPTGAIEIGPDITSRPRFFADRCNGCALCVAACPGLAIFVVDSSREGTEAVVVMPHEYHPLPRRGDTVQAVSREGEVLGRGRVLKVINVAKNDLTPLVHVAVPQELAMDVRAIRLLEGGDAIG